VEGADQVVVLLAALVVEERLALGGVPDEGGREPAPPVGGRGQRGGDLQDVERRPRVAVGEPGDQGQRVVLGVDRLRPEPPLAVGERPAEDHADLVLAEALEDVDPAAGEERRDDLEGRVLGRRADQDDRAPLDVGQEGVLLGLVEAVDLVHEQDRALAAGRQAVLGGGDDRPDLLHAG
jgi:hypothetical protein